MENFDIYSRCYVGLEWSFEAGKERSEGEGKDVTWWGGGEGGRG